MSYDPIDDLAEETIHDEPFEECDHDFEEGNCIECEEEDPDYDPTPYGDDLVSDPYDSIDYKGMEQAA